MKGQKGGKALVKKYGRAYMQQIGRNGAIAFWNKYKLIPVGTSQYAIVDRQTNKIIRVKDRGL